MASGSLGTLSVDLVAKTGGFDKNLDQAQKRTETFDRKMRRFSRNMNRHFSDIARSATQLAAGLTGVSVAVGAVMKSQADMVKRANESAQAIGIATGQLQAFQFATGKVGIESDKAADILKDLSDKIGDVALTGGGELAEPLEKLGLSADNLVKLKPVEMLTEIGNAISSLPAAAQVNILESMADEGSRLRPLLKDNAELLRLYTQRARELNLANSEIDVQKILQFWQAWDRVADAIKGLVRTATIELAPSLSDAADEMQRFIKESGETGKIKTFFDSLREQLDDIKNTLGDIAKFGSNALIARLFGITTATVTGTAQIAGSSSDMGRRLQSGTPTEEDLASLSKERLAALRQMYEERGRASTQRATQYPLGSDLNEANQKAADKYWDAALMIDRAMNKSPLKIDITRSANEPGTQDKPSTGRTNLPSGKTLAAGMTEAEQRHLESMQKSQDKYREWLDLQEQRKQGVSDLIQQFGTREQAAQAWYQAQVTRIRGLVGENQLADEMIANAHAQMVERMNADTDRMSVFATRAGENIQDQLGRTVSQTLRGEFDGILASWGDMLMEMVAQAQAAQLSRALLGKNFEKDGKFGGLIGAGIKTIGGMLGGGGVSSASAGQSLADAGIGGSSFGVPSFGGFFAKGGNPPIGKGSIVGENGPEMIVPRTPTTVIPNHALGQAQTAPVYVNIESPPGYQAETQQKQRPGGGIDLNVVYRHIENKLIQDTAKRGPVSRSYEQRWNLQTAANR